MNTTCQYVEVLANASDWLDRSPKGKSGCESATMVVAVSFGVAEIFCEISLRIEIDNEDAIARGCRQTAHVGRQGRLHDASLAVDESDYSLAVIGGICTHDLVSLSTVMRHVRQKYWHLCR